MLLEKKSAYYNLIITEAKETKGSNISPVLMIRERLKSVADSTSTFGEPEEDDEDFGQDKSNVLLRLMKLNLKEWYLLLIGFIAAGMTGAIQPVFALFWGEVFTTFSLTGEAFEEQRKFWSWMFVLLGVVSGASYWAYAINISYASEHLTTRLRLKVMENLLRQEIAWFDKEQFSIGKVITMLTRDPLIMQSVAGFMVGQVFSSIITLSVALLIAFIYGWKLALLLLIAIPIIIIASYEQVHQIRKFAFRDLESMNNAGKVASECIQNLKTVQSIGREAKFTEIYTEYLKVPYNENKKQAFIFAFIYAICQAVIFFLFSGAFKAGSYLIANGEMDSSDVFRVFFALSFSSVAAGAGCAYLQDYTKGKTSSRIVFYLMDKKSELDPLVNNGLSLPVEGKITFKNISFSYPSKKNVQILNGFDLQVEPGQTVALVGESGCGKSTIISLLERFYRPDRGVIQIDNMNIELFDVSCLRRQIGLVTQEPVLFNTTIKENIMYGAVALGVIPSDLEIINAAKAANIHEYIASLPEGYETLCEERGTQLSRGQKQRIAIARALIRKPRILLLDEATAALDNENEKIVQEALDRAIQGKSCIVVAHRLSTIQNADKIVVLRNGRVAEIGTHHDLIERHGFYYQLIKRQQL